MAERTFSEQEVSALLERAAELQVRNARPTDHRPGLTLSELETIAAEAGLDPALLRQAAAELDAPARSLFDSSTGTSATHVFVERWVPGRLTPEVWEDIVAELRHRYDSDLGAIMGLPGYGRSAIEQIGRTVEWRHTSMSGIETRVMVRQQGEGMRLRFSKRVGWGSTLAESATYGSILAGFGALLAGGLAESSTMGVITLVCMLLVAVPLIAAADTTWRKKKHREVEDLADRVANLAAAGADDVRAPAGAGLNEADVFAREPLIDLSSTHPTPAEDSAVKSGRQRTR